MENSVKIDRLALSLLILILFLFSCENKNTKKKKEVHQQQFISNQEVLLKNIISISKSNLDKVDVSVIGEERKNFIKKSLDYFSFLKVLKVQPSGDLEITTLSEGKDLTSLQLVLCESNELSRHLLKDESSGMDKFLFIFIRKKYESPQEGKNIFRIFANKQQLQKYPKEYLALSLLHELNHIYQFLIIPSMESSVDRENDSWRFQLTVWKSLMSEEQKNLYNKKLKEQKKKKFSSTSFEENDSWITQTFGSPLGYVDMFVFDAYGFKVFEKIYSKIQE